MVGGCSIDRTPMPVPKPCLISSRRRDRPEDTRFMKRTSVKPDDARLKFFTRKLYVKGQTLSGPAADQAETEWEEAIQAYRQHLRRIEKKLPKKARALARMSLHDARLVGEPLMFNGWARIAVLEQEMATEPILTLLVYQLSGRLRRIRRPKGWPDSGPPVHWLYDELDVRTRRQGGFMHRVLLSDGTVVAVPFRDAEVHRLPGVLLRGLRWDLTEPEASPMSEAIS